MRDEEVEVSVGSARGFTKDVTFNITYNEFELSMIQHALDILDIDTNEETPWGWANCPYEADIMCCPCLTKQL
eukprot:scaffold808_cov196-Alexandrium_tamarense.AAC.29